MSSSCTTGIQNCLSYFNPCSTNFEAFQFNRLTCCQKLCTIFFSTIGCAGCGIGSLAMYRVCLKNYSSLEQAQPPIPFVRIQISIQTSSQENALTSPFQPPHVIITQQGEGDQAAQIVQILGPNPISIKISTHHLVDGQNYNSRTFSGRHVLDMDNGRDLAPPASDDQSRYGVSLPGVVEA